MPEIVIRGEGGGEPPNRRRWPAVLALLLLLFLVVEAVILLRARPEPRISAGTPFLPAPAPPAAPAPGLPPGPAPRSLMPPEEPERELTVTEFLTALTRGASSEAGDRFVAAFARRPALKRTLVEFRDRRGSDAPAKELLRALYAQPEFGRLLAELKRDPELAGSFARVSRDPGVSLALRGMMSAAPAPVEAEERAPLDERSGSEEPGQAGAGPEAHATTPLGKIRQNVGERAAGRFALSALASMPREELKELDEACDRHDFCEPVAACQITGLWASCVKACRVSGKCPPELAGPPGAD